MASIRRKKFTGAGASEFDVISDNTTLYIFAALVCIGIAAAFI
jgi:hypothetical protein